MDPAVQAIAATIGSIPSEPTSGAVTDAAVIIATVPEPWARRTSVAMRNGTRNAGRLVPAMASARASPTPELRST